MTNKNDKTFIVSITVIAIIIALGLSIDIFSKAKKQHTLISPKLEIAKISETREMPETGKISEKSEEKQDQELNPKPPSLMVDNFEKGQTSGVFYERKNTIGSYQGTWAKRPSYSVITKLIDENDLQHGKFLSIEYKKEAGWAGYYSLLNNADVTDYNALTFWVKGEKGGEKFDIGLSDARMQDLQIDAVYAGPVDIFLPQGVTKEWQKVKVPLSRIASQLNLTNMGSVVFWFKYGGAGKVYINDIQFEFDKDVRVKEEYNAPRAVFDPQHPRSLWVWKIDPINNPKGRKELLDLCKRTAITNLYLYFGDFSPEREPEYSDKLADFLKEAHSLGLKVEALTGTPVWSLKEYHKACLDWIDAFLRFNKPRPQDMRMDGISLDVEPYLTSEWQSDKERVKADYLELLKKVRQLLGNSKQDMRLGVAISTFYSDIDNGKFEEEVLKYVDYAAVMSYYDDPNKILEKSIPHLIIADKLNKKIVLGVETQDLIALNQGERRFTFFEEGWENMEDVLTHVKEKIKSHPSFEGFAIHCDYSYILLQRGRNAPIKQRPKESYTITGTNRIKPVTIDGNLDDWDLSKPFIIDKKVNVVHGQFAWNGPQDLSAKTYSMRDDDNLYFAFEITDDKLVQQWTKNDMWQGDHIEMWLDMALLNDYNEAINSNDDFQFGFSPGNFADFNPEVYIWTPELSLNYQSEIQVASKKTDTGYIIEVKLPAVVLFALKDKIAGAGATGPSGLVGQPLPEKVSAWFKKADKLGISVDPSDTDDPANPQKVLMSSSVNRVWGDPTTFGFLELE